MIKTFADRRTQELYAKGTAKRFPPDVAARAARKLEYVDLAVRLDDLKVLRATGSTRLNATVKASTRSRSTTSGASAFASRAAMPTTSRSRTTTEV
jgi:plasmid maintenance system killer protein